MPLTPPEPPEPPAIPDDPAAMELPAVPVLPAPPVWEAELPETPLPDEPSAEEEPLPLAPPEIVAVEPGRSAQLGFAIKLPVLEPPCAKAIEPEPKMRAATLNNLIDNLIDLFMCFSLQPNARISWNARRRLLVSACFSHARSQRASRAEVTAGRTRLSG